MDKKVTDDFGRELIERVHDRTIAKYDRFLEGKFKASKELLDASRCAATHDEALRLMTPEIVTSVIANLLGLIEEEEGRLEVRWNGVDIREASESIIHALWSEDGWIQKFSKTRHVVR